MLVNGDKLIVTKKVASFLDEGDIVKVIDVSEDGMISFVFGEEFMHKGIMTTTEYENHFEKYVEKPNTVASDTIEELIDYSDISVFTAFNKCTVVACRLPNGFVIVESSACVSPDNYDKAMGVEICMNKIKDKLWELEGYKLQEELYKEDCGKQCCDCDCGDCENCSCDDDYDCNGCEDDCENDCDHCHCDKCEDKYDYTASCLYPDAFVFILIQTVMIARI